MKPFGNLFLILLLYATFAASEISAADGDWTSVKSKNFSLIGNATQPEIQNVALKMEEFRAAFQKLNPQINLNSPIPTTVIVFKSETDYEPYKPRRADGKPFPKINGYFLSAKDGNYITLSVGANLADAYGTIFHEYIHFLLDNNIGRGKIPTWFNEGLAEYFQTIKIETGRRITVGGLQKEHLQNLRKREPISSAEFFGTDSFTLQQQGDDGIGFFYSQAWALTHFLMQKKSAQTEKFLAFLIAGKDAKSAFEEAFEINYETAQTELKKYLAQGSLSEKIIDLKENLSFDSALETNILPLAEAKITLAEVLVLFKRLPEAETLLRESLNLNPKSSNVLVALGKLKIEQKKFAEAQEILERAMKTDEKNYAAYYNYALAISRAEMSDFGFIENYTYSDAEKMRAALRKAVELNPNFAESYELFALVAAVRNEGVEKAVEFLEKALKIAPGNQNYRIRQAELYFWKEDFANARRLAKSVAETASDFQLKLYAENTLNKINAYEAQLESIKKAQLDRKKDEIPDRIFSEEELREIREKGFNESINKLLTKPKSDEKRLFGYLTKIECQPKNILYYVKSENKILRFRSDSFETVSLVALTQEMFENRLACGEIFKDKPVVVLYNLKTNEVRAVEFVPANFKLSD